MNPTTKSVISGLSLAGLLGGCATVTPRSLVEAREAYMQSNDGLAGKLAPTELYDAKKVLDKADDELKMNGVTPLVADYTYIAQRKIELADVKARTAVDRHNIDESAKLGAIARDRQLKSGVAALAKSREQLKDERHANQVTTTALIAENNAQSDQLEDTASQLDAEKQARVTAEANLAGAMKDLAAVAAVKREPRGVVITLSGSVLFASGKYALLETAKTKLDQVAEALKAQSADRTMIVEGHTDSQGTDATNQPLSVNRAGAVRDYLVTRGVDARRISAVGLGATRPLLENNNAENRANNRRVEIIIEPARVTAR